MNEFTNDVRWIVLGTDGRHVTLGRHSDPTPEEIDKVESVLLKSQKAGWLAIMQGTYYGINKPTLVMVRPLGIPQKTWDQAVTCFEEMHTASLQFNG